MPSLRAVFGSVIVPLAVLGLVFVAGNSAGGVEAAPDRTPVDVQQATASEAPRPNVQQQQAGTIGEISGTALPGDTVRVAQGNALIGETAVGADGKWRVAIPETAAADVPYHVRLLPAAARGAVEPKDRPVSILVTVVIGSNKVEVRVQVTSPNGQVDVEVLAPIEPRCPDQAANEAKPGAQPAIPATYHRVRAGETLGTIAAKYGLTTTAIVLANRIRNPNLLYVGQRLLIPQR